jgi:hypothetical protein
MWSEMTQVTYVAENHEIQELESHLRRRLAGRVAELQIIPHDRGLVLRGRSLSYYAKQLAQHTLMTVTDLPLLANEIEVV